MIQFVEPNFVNEGSRGKLVQLVRDGYKQVNVIESVAGSVRGGHYHKFNAECFYVVSGALTLKLSRDEEREQHDFEEGAMFMVPPYVRHTFEYLKDTVLVSLYSDGVEISQTQKDIWTE